MKKALLFSFLFLLLNCSVLISSCKCKKKTTETNTAVIPPMGRDFEKEGYEKAIVIYYELDACKYLLQLYNEKKLEPTPALAPEFQKDQLMVWVKYVDKKDGMSVCMAGKMVEISDIQIRK